MGNVDQDRAIRTGRRSAESFSTMRRQRLLAGCAVCGFWCGLLQILVAPIGCDSKPPQPAGPTVAWFKDFDVQGLALCSNGDGGFFLAGLGANEGPVTVAKVTGEGGVVWARQGLGLEGKIHVAGIAPTFDRGAAVVGTVGERASTAADVFLLRIDAEGKELWVKTFGGQQFEQAASITVTRDGGFLIGGATNSFRAGPTDLYVARTDREGQLQWETSLGIDTNHEDGGSVAQTRDDGFVVAGSSGGCTFVAKCYASGKEEWSKTYCHDGANESGQHIVALPEGDFVVSAARTNKDQGVVLRRIQPWGDLLWERLLGPRDVLLHTPLLRSSNGGLVVGNRAHHDNESFAFVAGSDGNGRNLWERRLGEDRHGYCHVLDFASTTDGGVLVLSQAVAARHCWVAKLAPPASSSAK